jgi:methylenetetrahydrofolate dehydrogenase (NADP+)/methenyltetrahydrofolate cyclohydrolase
VTALILDGAALARQRAPVIAGRAAAVRDRRGYAPAVAIVAFSDERGRVPHVERKLLACDSAGVDAVLVTIPHGTSTRDAVGRMRDALATGRFDALFLQFPFPGAIDGDALAAAIPVALDVDIMTPVRIAHFMNGLDHLPPVTVAAGLLLLDAYNVSIRDLRGIVIADESPFALMFRAALAVRGADMGPLVPPAARDLLERVHAAELVVVAAGTPGLVKSTLLSTGAVAIDVGYFNPHGRGDIDLAPGIDHLAALSPVPGGIGPMTVSTLVERVVMFAEQSTLRSRP